MSFDPRIDPRYPGDVIKAEQDRQERDKRDLEERIRQANEERQRQQQQELEEQRRRSVR